MVAQGNRAFSSIAAGVAHNVTHIITILTHTQKRHASPLKLMEWQGFMCVMLGCSVGPGASHAGHAAAASRQNASSRAAQRIFAGRSRNQRCLALSSRAASDTYVHALNMMLPLGPY
jgi:hypothetical protein